MGEPREPIITRAGTGIAHGHSGNASSVTALTSEQNPGGVAIQFAEMPIGSGAPFHRHPSFDEVFIVLEGALEFQIDDEVSTARAGDTVWVPGERSHAPRAVAGNADGIARIIMLVTPARFEDFFHEMGAIIARGGEQDEIVQLGARYGIEFLERPAVRVRHDPPAR